MHSVNEPRFHELVPFVVLSQSLGDDCDDKAWRQYVNCIPDKAPSKVTCLCHNQLAQLIHQEVQTEQIQKSRQCNIADFEFRFRVIELAIVNIRISNESTLEQDKGNEQEYNGVCLRLLPVEINQVLHCLRIKYSEVVSIR